MTKAIYFEILNYSPDNLKLLENSFELIRLPDPSLLDASMLSEVSVLFAPLGFFFGSDLFSQSPNLKVIASNTTGIPHIDDVAAKEKDIKIVSLKNEKTFLDTITPTAELTLGLIICVVRNIFPASQSVLKGKWNRWDFGGDAMLSRMNLGIVGFGRLGRMVARYAAALGMKVIYYDPFVKTNSNTPFEKVDRLETLVGKADIVTVHATSTKRNKHMFNENIFSKFKKGSYFVNTARGELVDSEALINALKSGKLKGAALDVVDHEYDIGFSERVLDHPLIQYAHSHSHLIITPHIAGSTIDAWHLTQRFVIKKTIEYLNDSGKEFTS